MYLTEQELATIRQFFSTKPVLRAYLFGSYARGEADERSDVDLLVELDYNRLDAFDFLVWPQSLRRRLKKKVDIVSGLKPRGVASRKFYERVMTDRRQVYEAQA